MIRVGDRGNKEGCVALFGPERRVDAARTIVEGGGGGGGLRPFLTI